MENDPDKIEGKLVESIEIKELSSLTTDYAELGLDSILDNSIVKNIPILKTAVSLVKTGLNVRDRIYVKKIYGFLAQVGQTTQEQREKFVRDNCKNVKQFEEAVLLILEQADRMEKTTLIGKIFKACILGKIRYEEALKLSEMTNRVFWNDLLAMVKLRDTKVSNHQRLFNAGLFYIDEKQPTYSTFGKVEYKRNSYAFALRDIYYERYDNLEKYLLGL